MAVAYGFEHIASHISSETIFLHDFIHTTLSRVIEREMGCDKLRKRCRNDCGKCFYRAPSICARLKSTPFFVKRKLFSSLTKLSGSFLKTFICGLARYKFCISW